MTSIPSLRAEIRRLHKQPCDCELCGWRAPHKVINRRALLLELLPVPPASITVEEIKKRLGVRQNNAHMLLHRLVSQGLAMRVGERQDPMRPAVRWALYSRCPK